MTTWNQLGINEMTSLYLYGSVTKPTNVRSETLIRNSALPPVQMDAVSFMLREIGVRLQLFCWAMGCGITGPSQMGLCWSRAAVRRAGIW